MAYRTILVHLGDPAIVDATLKTAIRLAVDHKAHLIGIHVLPSIRIYASVEAYIPTEVIETQRTENQKVAGSIGEKFEAEIKKAGVLGAGVSGEWRISDVQGQSLASEIVSHGRRADLIVTSQANPDDDFQGTSNWGEQIMMEAGRPVLFVPYIGCRQPAGKNIMVAWNGSREAARAVFDALPILKRAESVTILWANPPATTDDDLAVRGSEIANTLARHGVKVTATHDINKEISIGEELLSRASDSGADLIVMGGYGHSRLRELVLGGVTRLILQSMTVPVLMSH